MKEAMKSRIHLYEQCGHYVLVDVNSGEDHLIYRMIYDIMDIFDGTNDERVKQELAGKYEEAELDEALGELKELIDEKLLFAPDIEVPPTFKQKGVVKSLCLMVAQDCNMRCKYCFGDGGSYGQERAVMSPEVGKAAVDFLLKNAGLRKHFEIDFFGGEPLMNMKTVKAVTNYVHQKEKELNVHFKLTMTTNGLLLNEENRTWLNDNNLSLVLSTDGRKDVHDRMRPDAGGQGTYDRVMKNFKAMVDSRNGENYYMRGTYTKHNLDFTKDVLDMNDKGFDILSVEPVVAKDAPDYALTDAELPRIYEEYDRLTEAYMKRRREGRGFFFFHFNMDLSNGPCIAKRLAGCGSGHEYYAVSENGDLYPCHQFVGRGKYKLGDVFHGVNHPEVSQYFRESHVLNKPKCRDCWARFFCSGGCHANADLFSGDIREPWDTGCSIQRMRQETAIHLQALQQERGLSNDNEQA